MEARGKEAAGETLAPLKSHAIGRPSTVHQLVPLLLSSRGPRWQSPSHCTPLTVDGGRRLERAEPNDSQVASTQPPSHFGQCCMPQSILFPTDPARNERHELREILERNEMRIRTHTDPTRNERHEQRPTGNARERWDEDKNHIKG